ncbi:unnamed protein product [Ceratitis capitata]|uniref:(Mediterranean fruit fly) hypothetical protein n=1 Tax=Ceratitis capitata TaxID=7213 RepID=A0A811V148_CERCA|nr:unnamed protein product [Ceratitis capitata]
MSATKALSWLGSHKGVEETETETQPASQPGRVNACSLTSNLKGDKSLQLKGKSVEEESSATAAGSLLHLPKSVWEQILIFAQLRTNSGDEFVPAGADPLNT